MTTVTLLRQQNKLVGFTAAGHTEAGEYGSDIVCSAVSALTQTTVMALEELLHASMALQVEAGDMHCVLAADTPESTARDADLLLAAMSIGLGAIQKQYPENLIVQEREV
ncbi:MAG: ribosomal-processing cysteine protease Prp [Eubacteriales bacterium]|nr:ribosomal-processing cysteine protease Prp [Eubacteriales bacterium]